MAIKNVIASSETHVNCLETLKSPCRWSLSVTP